MSDSIIGSGWATPTVDIRESLRRFAETAMKETGYGPPYQLFCSGARLIDMYRHGALRPDDETIMPMIPDHDRKMVEDYLSNEHGKPSGATTG